MRKTCTTCQVEKDLDLFANEKGGKYGRSSKCKECKKEYARQYRERNPEKHRASLRNSYQKYRDERREAASEAYQRDAEDIKERQRAYYQRTKTYWQEYNKKYRSENKEVMVAMAAKRRARKKALPDNLTADETRQILTRFNDTCSLSDDVVIHLDHFIPISTGHAGTIKENMVPLSEILNRSKRARNPFEWAETLTPEQRSNFNEVVEYLAEINGLTVTKYREFVFWCFENKRDVSEINESNRDSLALWKRTKDAA